jgi:hypothetical protein
MSYSEMEKLAQIMGKSILDKMKIENDATMYKILIFISINNIAIGAILFLLK